ncbi:MAG: long-chain acyl-CoA synthetase [Baekduia sp.]|jgi:long-chain acyl-CoA synthetase|nr:long-chain acyl-CoA synthetase [Baekduia sp.]
MSTHATSPVAASSGASHADTLGHLLLEALERHSGAAMKFRDGDVWAEWSFAEVGRMTSELARGLIALGLQPGDRVAILGGTCPDWTVADCAALVAGLTVVPIYQTNPPEECAYVLAHSGARAVICEDAAQLAKIEAVRDACPALEDVLSFGDFAALRRRGMDETDAGAVAQRLAAVRPDDVATIVYTSGTTGPPKGCMLTHANCLFTARAYERDLALTSPLTIFMFLPLAHALARMVQMVSLDVGGTLAYWRGDSRLLLEDLAEARPTHFPSVPRVFEKVHTQALAEAAAGGPVQRRMFEAALAIGLRTRRAERNGGANVALRAAHAVADRLVLTKVRALFGGELQVALTGAAPIARDVLDFFDACGVLVLEGYGMSETCAAGTLNTPGALRFGSVGRPLRGTDVTIAQDGEVLMRGPHVFAGYHGDERSTAEALRGGWLTTGDLGELDDAGFLHITGRKKDLIITSSGKNIAPAVVEAALRESRWISQAVVYGDQRSYLVALLTLDEDQAAALAAELHLAPDLAVLAADPRVNELLAQEVEAANDRFARIEQIKRFAVLDHDFTERAGELTPTLKLRRPVVYDRYAQRFAALYE